MQKTEKLPNLFLIGAPKCGTTSMTHYLSLHPQIFVPAIEEPQYFADDYGGRDIRKCKQYLSLFARSSSQHTWLTDASTLYLYFETAIPNILRFNSDARFIVMLRDPLAMIPSWYAQMKVSRNGREDAETLAKAWDLTCERKAGRSVPDGCTDPRLLYYDEIAKYGGQLKRLFQLVPSDHVHVIMFDRLVADPREVYDGVCAFLELEKIDDIDFNALNSRKVWRSKILQRTLANRFVPRTKRVLHAAGLLWLMDPLRQVAFKKITAGYIPMDVAAKIRDCYRDDLHNLAQLLNTSLEHWLQVSSSLSFDTREPELILNESS